MGDLERTVGLLDKLIGFPTVSADSNLGMIEFLAEMLENASARVQVFHDETGAKANLFATIGPDRDGGIVLAGHTDVVPVEGQQWHTNPFRMHENGGRLYGRGACDMKGFIAAAVAMAPYYSRYAKRRPVHFAFTYDEEIGCFGAQALVRSLEAAGVRPGVAIIGEPTSMQVIDGHKGCYEYTTRFVGLEGHGSLPEAGVNAVEYAARYVGELVEIKQLLRERAVQGSRFDPPWTTVSTGRFNGGIARNVIPGSAEVEWEMRPVCDEDSEFVKSRLDHLCRQVLLPQMRAVSPKAEIVLEVVSEIEGLEPAQENEARAILAELTGSDETDLVSFGTEAGIYQSMGMNVAVCGPGSIEQAHKPDEYVSVGQIDDCLGMLRNLTVKL
ncbi:MAG: acetylornithine deacetylase [Gammaproteobacteria bacterium]|nr:acetylornithine deacetylase [Gammaproteobacteria bacterium]MYD76413.1 acetylornithine deacetylase [Gammaproteobacteria bacterium]MYJ53238.1 acetylornithine deacetylase [Gammaproteobacteria bacterium]